MAILGVLHHPHPYFQHLWFCLVSQVFSHGFLYQCKLDMHERYVFNVPLRSPASRLKAPIKMPNLSSILFRKDDSCFPRHGWVVDLLQTSLRLLWVIAQALWSPHYTGGGGIFSSSMDLGWAEIHRSSSSFFFFFFFFSTWVLVVPVGSFLWRQQQQWQQVTAMTRRTLKGRAMMTPRHMLWYTPSWCLVSTRFQNQVKKSLILSMAGRLKNAEKVALSRNFYNTMEIIETRPLESIFQLQSGSKHRRKSLRTVQFFLCQSQWRVYFGLCGFKVEGRRVRANASVRTFRILHRCAGLQSLPRLGVAHRHTPTSPLN